MIDQEDQVVRPSLLEKESRGGDINEGGISFQAEVVLSYIPKWIAMEGFTVLLREGMGDVEAKFFSPGHGCKKEFIEVKDHIVQPSEFWAEIDRFKEMEAGSPGEHQWFTLATAGLSLTLHPLVNTLRRIRDPYGFYDEDSVIMRNSYEEYVQKVRALKRSKEDADFLYRKVLIEADLSMHRSHGKALFKQSLRDHLLYHQDMPDRVLDDIYADLATFVHSRRNQPISRREIEEKLREKVPAALLPPVQPVRVHTIASENEVALNTTVLSLAWEPFFGGAAREYPPPRIWNERLLGDLRETKDWILKDRGSRRILLSGNRRLSASIAFGYIFSAVSGFGVEMFYRSATWATDTHPDEATPTYSLISRGSYDHVAGDRLVVSVSIMRDIVSEVERDLERHGLVEMPSLHIKGESPIVSPQQANLIVREIKNLLSAALSCTGARQLDLFFAGPAFLALFLGHRLNATAVVQCYECTATGRYVPTCRLC